MEAPRPGASRDVATGDGQRPARRQATTLTINGSTASAAPIATTHQPDPVLATTLVVTVAGADAGGTPVQPLGLQTVTLTQDGQDLVWHVELTGSLSPGALGRDHESVCLLLGRSLTGPVSSQLCLAGPRRGARPPRALYSPITRAGPGRAG
jgi:hypothetical protein